MFGFTCMPLCITSSAIRAQRTAGASRHPAFPAPSALSRATTDAKLGRNAPRECETARAIRIGMRDELSSRAPDAAQRFFNGALQSRGPCIGKMHSFWVPALRGTAYALQPVRDTRERMPVLRTPSLRAQRSNPDCLRGQILVCFAALAMTWREYVCAASLAYSPSVASTNPRGSAQNSRITR